MIGDVYGLLATDGGYSFSQIDVMYLEDATLLIEYWERVPPLRRLVASVAQGLGVELPSPGRSSRELPEIPPDDEE